MLGSHVERAFGSVKHALHLGAVALASGLLLSFGALVLYISTQKEIILYVGLARGFIVLRMMCVFMPLWS